MNPILGNALMPLPCIAFNLAPCFKTALLQCRQIPPLLALPSHLHCVLPNQSPHHLFLHIAVLQHLRWAHRVLSIAPRLPSLSAEPLPPPECRMAVGAYTGLGIMELLFEALLGGQQWSKHFIGSSFSPHSSAVKKALLLLPSFTME